MDTNRSSNSSNSGNDSSSSSSRSSNDNSSNNRRGDGVSEARAGEDVGPVAAAPNLFFV